MSTLPEDVQALHDRWLTDKLADDEVDEGLGGPDGNLYYADDDDFWREFDGLREAVWVEAEHPRDWRGRWIPKFVLSPIGLPGSGKGTIGKALAEHYGVPHISTGEMLRALPRDSDLGRQIFPAIERGDLAPTHLVAQMVADRLAQPDMRDGVILDGSPRTQLEKEMLEQMGVRPTFVELAVDRDVALERLLKRAEIEGRADDKPEVIANRFRVYEAETEPMLQQLRDSGEMVTVQQADAGPDVNVARTKAALAPLKLAEAGYIERLHPRDRLGKWIDVPDFRSLGAGAPPTFRTPTMKPSSKQGRVGRRVAARGWKERVNELRHVPSLGQESLLSRRRAAMEVKQPSEEQPVEEPRFAPGTVYYARKLARDDVNTRQMTRLEAERFLSRPEEDLPYAVFNRENEVTIAYYSDPAEAEAHVERLNERDLEFEEEYRARREERARERVARVEEYTAAQTFLDEWWGAPGRRGRYQTMGGDPGTAFEEQHERIMEAGALIDAEVRRRGKESEARLADLVKRHRAKKAEAKKWAEEEERLAYEEVARILYEQHGWVDVSGYGPPKPEDMKRRHQAYQRERNKRRPDYAVLGTNQVVDDAWYLRYENPDGRVQAAHNEWVETMWSREAGNEGVDTLAGQIHEARRELHWTRRSNTYEVLEEIRPFASEGDLNYIRDLNTGNPDADRQLAQASEWLPLAWVESSNGHATTLAVGTEADRGKYVHSYIGDVRPGGRNISLILGSPSPEGRGVNKGVGTMIHELVHRAEYTRDGIKGAEWTFYASRVSPGINRQWEETKLLSDLTGSDGYKPNEKARVDKFTDFYSGKTYGDNPDSSYEILTMGIQDLVTGEHGIVLDDDEYRQFVLGAMALL